MRILYAYVAVLALIGVQIAYFYGLLPPVVASHFNGNGIANGYMSRGGFVGFYIGLVFFLFAVFGGISGLIRAVPPESINVPNRVYWFSPERADESRAWLARELQGFGLVVVLFVAAVMQRVFVANVGAERPCLPTPYIFFCVGGLVVALVVMTVRLFRRFG